MAAPARGVAVRGPLLQPGPALVYLVLLLSLAGFWIRDVVTGARERVPPAAAPAAVFAVAPGVPEDGREPAPLALARGGGAVVVRFVAVPDASAPLAVELAVDGRSVWSGVARPDAAGDVSIVIRPARLQPGLRYDLTLARESRVVARRILAVER